METPISEVHRLLDAKKAWIQLQLQKTAQVAGLKLAGAEGDRIFYLGKPLSLRFCQAAQNRISIIEGENEFLIHHTGSQPNRLTTINKIKNKLRAQANNLLPEKVAFWSEKMGLRPAGVRIKQYKARWGSCSRAGEVQLNWRLIGASEGVIDYVVVHELAHLKFFNHSAEFWALVGHFQPDYKGQKRWLKEFGCFLML